MALLSAAATPSPPSTTRSSAAGSLLGLPEHWVSLGFVTDPRRGRAIWNTQFALILGAHLLAVVLGIASPGRGRLVAHLPMTVLMVGYTVFGLWLLSTASTG